MILHKYKVIKLFFILYIVAIIRITQLPINWNLRCDFSAIHYNLVPLHIFIQKIEGLKAVYTCGYDVKKYLLPTAKMIFESFGYNILLFCPLGLFLPILFKECYTLKKIAIISLIFSICIEVLQLLTMFMSLTYGRSFDIDDIIANVLGGLIGFCFYKVINNLIKQRSRDNGTVD